MILQGAFGRLDPTGEEPGLWWIRYQRLGFGSRSWWEWNCTGKTWRDRGDCQPGYLSLLGLCKVTSADLFHWTWSVISAAGSMRRRWHWTGENSARWPGSSTSWERCNFPFGRFLFCVVDMSLSLFDICFVRDCDYAFVFQVTPEQWDMMEQMIRSTNKKSKL